MKVAVSPTPSAPGIRADSSAESGSVLFTVEFSSLGTSGMLALLKRTSRVAVLPSASVAVRAMVCSPAGRPWPIWSPCLTATPSRVMAGVPTTPEASLILTLRATVEVSRCPVAGTLLSTSGAVLSVVKRRVEVLSPTTALMVWAPSASAVVSTSARLPSAGSAAPSGAVTSNRTTLVSTEL